VEEEGAGDVPGAAVAAVGLCCAPTWSAMPAITFKKRAFENKIIALLESIDTAS
jgi:hypothetical protein